MNHISIMFMSVGLAMDAFAVAIAKGVILHPKHLFKNALILSLLFGLFQAIMPLIGYYACIHLADYIIAFDHWVAFILLTFLGINMIREAKNNDQSSQQLVTYIPVKQLLLLAIATSIDALVIGVSFAFLQAPIFLACISIGVITFLLCMIGVYIGKYIGNSIQSYAVYFGGFLLIALGIKTLIEHLMIG